MRLAECLKEMTMQAEILNSRSLMKNTKGLSTVEYVIILALIAVGGLGLWKQFGKKVTDGITHADKEFGATIPK